MITAPEAAASITSDLEIPPTPVCSTLQRDLGVRELGDLVLDRLERAGHVRLQHEVELDRLALLHALEDVLEAHRRRPAARQRLGLEADRALAGQVARLAVVVDRAHRLAGVGHAVEAEDLDRLARAPPA